MIEQIKKAARLSKLDIPEDTDMQRMIGLVAAIEDVQIEAADVPRTEGFFREDKPRQSLKAEMILKNAPDTDGSFFVVPKILSDDCECS